MRLVPMFSHVAWKQQVFFILEWAVVNHGVGLVEKNIVANIMMQLQVKDYLRQKTVMMHLVAQKRKTSNKMTIVLAVTRDTVVNGGKIHTYT